MLYKIMVKTKTAPECIEPDLYFTYVVNAKDAKRIVSENLEMRDFRITGAEPAKLWEITPKSFTIGIRRRHC